MLPTKLLRVLPALLLAGCASVVPHNQTPDPDPFQYTNRKIFTFNKKLDKYILKPTAIAYQDITTPWMRTGVRNFFANVLEIPTSINEVFQGKFKEAGVTITRFGVNTTAGVLGLVDVAGEMGLEYRRTTFGETLTYWGMEYSPYLMLPVIGPSTIRDSVGRLADAQVNPFFYATHHHYIVPYYLLYGISSREALLKNEDLFGVLAVDDYVFVRDAYLQRAARANRTGSFFGAGANSSTTSKGSDTFDDEFEDEFE